MNNSNTKNILGEALSLPVEERAKIVEQLIKSFDMPDESIDKIWKKEAENRIGAYERGEIDAISLEEGLEKYEKRS